MSEVKHNTKIEWTHHPGFKGETWNPVVGCTKVSQGCRFCYAETLHDRRHKAYEAGARLPQQYAEPFKHVQLLPKRLELPLRWQKPRSVFVNSLSDLFHEDVPRGFIDAVFAVMALRPHHRFMILTKRHREMRDYLADAAVRERVSEGAEGLIDNHGTRQEKWNLSRRRNACAPTVRTWPLPNVWVGVSVEDQKAADARIPVLAATPAAVRFLSCEPLLGPISFDLTVREGDEYGEGAVRLDMLTGYRFLRDGFEKPLQPTGAIHWVIAGAESGTGARPMDEDWVRDICHACEIERIPFFYKQNADKGRKLSLPELDGRRWADLPAQNR